MCYNSQLKIMSSHTHKETIISPDSSSKSHSPFAYRSSREVLKKKSLQIFLTV